MAEKLPRQVVHAAETIGGYLGVTHAYFDAAGKVLDDDGPSPPETRYIVTGNYYGSSVFVLENGHVTRIMEVE